MNRPFRSRVGAGLSRLQWLALAIACAALTALGAFVLHERADSRKEQPHASGGHDDHDHDAGKKTEVASGKKEGKAAEAHAGDEPKVTLSEEQIKSSNIALVDAGPGRVRLALQLPGEIRYNEDRTAHVVPRVGGVVESVSANLGQQVRKGQILAVIASSAVSEQRSELLSAQRRLALAQSTYAREKKLWDERISAEQDLLQARQVMQEAEIAVGNARQKLMAMGTDAGGAGALNRYEIRAPFDGMVMEKHIALGEAVKEDAQVFTLSDLSTVWAEINVAAKDLPFVRVGGRARVTATAFDAKADGTIAYVGSLIGEQTRTARGRVVLPNPQGAWRPGLFANVEITASEAEVAIAVPNDAIQIIESNPSVFIRTKDGFAARRVQLGRSDDRFTEIIKGLAKGESLATGNTFTLKAELGKRSAEHSH